MTAGLIQFYDSTNVAAIPDNCQACASYCDGEVSPNGWHELTVRFPELARQQRVLSIGSRAGTICRAVDVEPGNPLDPAAAAAQILMLVHRGVYLPVVYTMGSLMGACRAALTQTGLKRWQYGLWLADPTGHEPTAQWLTDNDLDAIQYGWSSMHQAPAGTDINVALERFFPPLDVPKPAPAPVPAGALHAKVSLNLADGHFSASALPRTGAAATTNGRRHFHGSVDERTGDFQVHRGRILNR